MQRINKSVFWLVGLSVISIGSAGLFFMAKAYPGSIGANIFSERQTIIDVAGPEKPVVFPKVVTVFPADGARDIMLDIEDPIVVDFDKSTKGFFVKFALDPEVIVAYQPNEEKNQFKLLPKSNLIGGKKYSLAISIKKLSEADDKYQEIFKGTFETLPEKPDVWEKDFALRLEQARKYTRPKVMEGKYIDINLETQIMAIFEQGRLLDVYLISSGKRGMDTKKGTFAIRNKANRPWSKMYSLFMPNWMALVSDGKFGIHELPEWPGGYKEGASHLGTPVSHGCVRLGVGPAKRVFDWAEIGTPVIIY